MKKLAIVLVLLFSMKAVGASLTLGGSLLNTFSALNASKINWYSFEEAMELNEKEKKPIFIDIYTDWCGWCKKMDVGTFSDPDVVKFMSANFLAVKLNAEQKQAIVFKEKLYEYQQYGKSYYNELAVQLLNSKMSFPSFVILSKKAVKIGQLVGYQAPGVLLSQLQKYVGK